MIEKNEPYYDERPDCYYEETADQYNTEQRQEQSEFAANVKETENIINSFYTVEQKPLSTGSTKVDRLLNGGLYEGSIYIVAGETSTGKTSFVQNIADNIAKRGEKVIVFSLEMSQKELIKRSICSIGSGNVSYNQIDKEGLQRANKTISDTIEIYKTKISPNKIIYDNVFTFFRFANEDGIKDKIDKVTAELKQAAQQANTVPKKPIIIIDYIQLIQTPKSPNSKFDYMTEQDRLKNIITELKRISNEYQSTIICISSLSRGAGQETKHKLKGSGDLEYTADCILSLTEEKQEEYKEINSENDYFCMKDAEKLLTKEIKCNVEKMREGAANISTRLFFKPAEFRFIDDIEENIFESENSKSEKPKNKRTKNSW